MIAAVIILTAVLAVITVIVVARSLRLGGRPRPLVLMCGAAAIAVSARAGYWPLLLTETAILISFAITFAYTSRERWRRRGHKPIRTAEKG